MVNQGSSFEQIMMGRCHQCYIPSFVEISPPVPDRKIFEGFLPYMGRGSHFGHMTSIMSINFHFLEPESLHIKFGFNWPSGFWEKQVLSFICNWLWVKVNKWPWPLILTYLHNFMQFQATGCKTSEKSTVFTFTYRKALLTIFDLAVK